MIKPKNLLIVRTDRIGDVVLSLPLAGIVKKHFPGCRVTFLVKEYTRPIVEKHESVDEVLVISEKMGKIDIGSNLKLIKSRNFDACIVVYPTFKIALLMALSGISNRIGTGYRWYSFLFNNKIFEHRKDAKRHELEYNVNLLKIFGIEEKMSPAVVNFGLKPEGQGGAKIDHLLSQNNISSDKPLVIVHPGSGGSAVDLPENKLRLLVEKMARELNINIVITGSEAEKEICSRVKGTTSAVNLAGQFSLSELIWLISRSCMMVANSTGPIHLAAALNKYVVGFYPKITACSPKRWGPYTEKGFIFTPPINCTDCTRSQCEKLNCMDKINVNEVFDSIKIALGNSV